jgi:thiol-disulfide isomerase/thioredoxin
MTTLGPKANWVHLETAAPQCLPADANGGRVDLVRHAGGTILFENAGKNDWLQTGELWQVGAGWRLTDAPTPGAQPLDAADLAAGKGNAAAQDPEALKLIDDLTALDKSAPPSSDAAASARHHLLRSDILEKIIAHVKAEQRDAWIRQLADSLSTAAQAGGTLDGPGMKRVLRLEQAVAEAMPGSNLAAYVAFREMQADYSVKIAAPKADFNKIQADWLERLGKFAQTYPKAEDTPDALLQLGMVSEFLNKDTEAKNWYRTLSRNFADKPQAAKAAGAIKRLDLEGQPLKLAAPLLTDPNTAFDIDQLNGKVVVVYYWASWNTQSVADFARLKSLLETYGSKGLEVLTVNLDGSIEEAKAYLARQKTVGTHLFQAGGLESKLATDYGILVLPNLFLVGKDGKVASRNVQIGNLEDELKKQMK